MNAALTSCRVSVVEDEVRCLAVAQAPGLSLTHPHSTSHEGHLYLGGGGGGGGGVWQQLWQWKQQGQKRPGKRPWHASSSSRRGCSRSVENVSCLLGGQEITQCSHFESGMVERDQGNCQHGIKQTRSMVEGAAMQACVLPGNPGRKISPL